MVYKTAYIACISPVNSDTGMDNRGIENVSKDTLETNAHLITSMHMHEYVKKMQIHIQANYYALTSLQLICDTMGKYRKEWSSVTELCVYIGFNYFSGLSADRDIGRFRAMHSFVESITELVPHVQKLTLRGDGQCEAADVWFTELVDHYSGQLKYLDRDSQLLSDPLETTPRVFGQLTSLSLTFNDFANYTVAIAAAVSLRSLRLFGIPCDVESSLPAHNSGSAAHSIIEFPELRHLMLQYPTGSPNVFADTQAHTRMPEIHPPQLESLYVLYGGNYCPVLASTVLPARMKIVNIIGQSDTLKLLNRQISKTHTTKIGKLAVTALLKPTENTLGTKTLLNSLFNCTRVAQHGCLRLDMTLGVCPGDFDDMAITHLQIGTPVSPQLMVDFIHKLHTLVDVNFTNASPKNATKLVEPGLNDTAVVFFRAPIHRLAIRFNNDDDDDDNDDDGIMVEGDPVLIKYLMVRMPVLRELAANRVSAEAVWRFVELFGLKFPNLGHVSFELEGYPKFIYMKDSPK
ncbi:hypothetical protein IWW50_003549 [Coemansia erecta]|nr:hypothetical protein GGF43_000581 [Coemansia sp. RSA 2618]KAJ2823974.1 hypothetical protein IWW50_003549 [Coemansia erecta]